MRQFKEIVTLYIVILHQSLNLIKTRMDAICLQCEHKTYFFLSIKI